MNESLTTTRTLMGRLQRGDDLLDALTDICRREGITAGRVMALGAVECARMAFYDQERREYAYRDIKAPLELLALVGNASLRDGEPVVHAHVTLSDEEGRAFGGHLASGTRVFACEYVIDIYDSRAFHRGYDEATGLPLWRSDD